MAAARQSKPDQSVTKDMLKIKGLSDPESATPGSQKTSCPRIGWLGPTSRTPLLRGATIALRGRR
jgi:hypothetical protein